MQKGWTKGGGGGAGKQGWVVSSIDAECRQGVKQIKEKRHLNCVANQLQPTSPVSYTTGELTHDPMTVAGTRRCTEPPALRIPVESFHFARKASC